MNRITATLAAVALALAAGLTACAAPDASSRGALPQVSLSAAVPTKPKVSTCDVAREAILTGTKADITRAMKALQADKTADATAREYARYYTGRDAKDPLMQEADLGLIQATCSLS